LSKLPNQEQAESIRKAWLAQINAYEHNAGLDYEFRGERHHSLNFSLEPLIKELQICVANKYAYDNWGAVGDAQFQLPAIIVNHYLNKKTPFSEQSLLKNPDLIRSVEVGKQKTKWWDMDELINARAAFARGKDSSPKLYTPTRELGDWNPAANAEDLKTLRAYQKRQLADVSSFKQKLESLSFLPEEIKEADFVGGPGGPGWKF
jgi:hypothetical protein